NAAGRRRCRGVLQGCAVAVRGGPTSLGAAMGRLAPIATATRALTRHARGRNYGSAARTHARAHRGEPRAGTIVPRGGPGWREPSSVRGRAHARSPTVGRRRRPIIGDGGTIAGRSSNPAGGFVRARGRRTTRRARDVS